jgi:L-threonylcarbamoyladenylate synthase
VVSRILQAKDDGLSRPDLARVKACLTAGGVVAYPTETLYGLGCNPRDREAVVRVTTLKKRPAGKPLPLIASSTAAALEVADPGSGESRRLWELLTRRLWPGPLTVVVTARPGLADGVTGGGGRVGIRVSSLPLARQIARACGGVVVATSANRSGEAVPVTAGEVVIALAAGPDLIVDGGPVPGGAPSTVVELGRDAPRVLREGVIPVPVLARILGQAPEPAD